LHGEASVGQEEAPRRSKLQVSPLTTRSLDRTCPSLAWGSLSRSTPISAALDPGDVEVEAFTQGHGGVEEAQAGRGGVEVELVPRRAAAEALVDVAFEVR